MDCQGSRASLVSRGAARDLSRKAHSTIGTVTAKNPAGDFSALANDRAPEHDEYSAISRCPAHAQDEESDPWRFR